MKAGYLWLIAVWAMMVGGVLQAHAEMYLWTDEQGVVHMTDQWNNVPEAARPRVTVRESSATPGEPDTPPVQAPPATEPRPISPPTVQMPPDLTPPPPPAASAPTVQPTPPESSDDITIARPFSHRGKKRSAPFPYNVRLDPNDSNFVWVGPNRVPKETFSYPHVSLDTQAQFRSRLRALEQRRTGPQDTSQGRRPHP